MNDIVKFRERVESRLHEYSGNSAQGGLFSAQSLTQEALQLGNHANSSEFIAVNFNKREIKNYTKLASKFDRVRAHDESLRNKPELRTFYSNQWV